MQRVKRVAALWNWIPAFRAVAETEHLPTASEKLSISAPALSRTIRLLEDELGAPLFRRAGRRLELNDAGRAFLASVRDAMNHVHDGVMAVQGSRLQGPLYVASNDFVATAYLTPALERLRSAHPEMVPWVVSVPHYCIVQELQRGELDVSLQAIAPDSDDVTVTRLAEEPNRIYCGEGHPLYGARNVKLEDVLDHEFVHTPADKFDWVGDMARGASERRFTARVEKTRLALELCASGRYLALLPDAVARQTQVHVHPLPLGVVSHTPILAVHRGPVAPRGRVQVLLDVLREELSPRPIPTSHSAPLSVVEQ